MILDLAPDWAGYVRWKPEFAKAIDERLHPMRWLDMMVLTGRAVFMRSRGAAIIFEKRTFPSGVGEVHGLVAAGDLREIVEELIPQAEAWGRERSCELITIESRPGWARVMRCHGYEPHQVSVRKELEPWG